MRKLGLSEEQIGAIRIAYYGNNTPSDKILIYQAQAERWTKRLSDILGAVDIDYARKLVHDMRKNGMLPKLGKNTGPRLF